MSKCDRCVTDKTLCTDCSDNPIYANILKKNIIAMMMKINKHEKRN